MRRYWLPITMLAVILLLMLFFGGILTGRVNRELQNPYSRLMRVQGTRFGRPMDQVYPNVMSEYYENLKITKPKDIWVPSESSYALRPGFSEPDFILREQEIPPVTWLEPEFELTFLRSLKNDKLRMAVIKSLYERKGPKTDKTAADWNRAERAKEVKRVRRIVRWYELDRKDFGRSFNDWWRDNAVTFGLNENGDPLPETPQKAAQK